MTSVMMDAARALPSQIASAFGPHAENVEKPDLEFLHDLPP
ncbi:hypothetical protein [Mesorhizobium sp. M1334]